jgi:uncharacterized protein YhbP (UPF0306 family)
MYTDKRIINFIEKHHVLTIATCVDNEPWCANCFYAYLEDENALVFTTDSVTRHGKEFVKNPFVAGSIVLETWITGKIKGIQFQGVISEPDENRMKKAKSVYLKRFPVAVLMETKLWVVDLALIKLTDNRLGFGKKIIWEKHGAQGSVPGAQGKTKK